jgi:peptidoglycan biosynthesis protein MviN/MurJ (putative lipid II flippase)
MFHMIATMLMNLLTIGFMWVMTVGIVKWSLSQQHLIHLLGVIMLGGGAIVISALLTKRICKNCWSRFFPAKPA